MKALIFARVSTITQDYERQIDALKDEAHRCGYSDSDIEVIAYKESGIKLAEAERQGLQALYEALNTKQYDTLFVWELSRLSRRTTDLYKIRDRLIGDAVQLIVMIPYMRLLDADGKITQTASITFALFASLAESEMMLKGERLREGKIAKLRQGKQAGVQIAFGYTQDADRNIIIDEKQAAVVRRIYDLYNSGEYSVLKIARLMRDTGAMTFTNEGDGKQTIRNILNRKSYIGQTDDKRNKHLVYPRIIDDDTFNKAREISKTHRREPKTINMTYLGRKLIMLEGYNHYLTPDSDKYRYMETGISFAIHRGLMDEIIWDCVKRYYRPTDLDNMKKEAKQTAVDNHRMWAKQQRDLEDYVRRIDKINERIIEGKLNEDKGDKMIDELKDKIKEAENNCAKMKAREDSLLRHLADICNMKIDLDNMDDIDEQKRIVDDTIEKGIIEKTERFGGELVFYLRDGHTAKYIWHSDNVRRRWFKFVE